MLRVLMSGNPFWNNIRNVFKLCSFNHTMNYRRLGLALIIMGILIVNLPSFLTITGAVVATSNIVSRGGIVIGGIFIIGGFILILQGNQTVSHRILGSRIPKKKKEKIEHNYPTKEELKRFVERFRKRKRLGEELEKEGRP